MSLEPTTDLAMYAPKTDLVRFATEAQQVHGIAKALSATSFVPKPMQGRPDEITAAILFGRELGMDPMTALQTVNVIEGRPTLTANAMRGLAQSCGVMFRVLEQSDTRVVMQAKGPGMNEWTGVTWTLDRARKMGLDQKSNWKKMPQAMLIARATSELCRLVAANVLLGLPYSVEELTDRPHENAHAEQAEQPAARRTVRRQPYQATVDTPLPEPAPAPSTEESSSPVAIDSAPAIDPNVRKALMASFNEIGVRVRDERLRYVSAVVGREVNSVNDLNNDEALGVLDRLKNDIRDRDVHWVEDGQ